MSKLKAYVIGVGVVNMTTGMTQHEWSIYENKGLFAFLTTGGYLLFGTEDSFVDNDEVTLVSNEGRKLGKTAKIIGFAPCTKDALLSMLKKNNYDYYPIKAFRARATGNKKLSTSYSVKGIENL